MLAATALGLIGVFARPSPVHAECPYIPPYPAVTEATSSAREIIVGTVLENIGGQFADFRMRVDHVLRGSAATGDVRRVRNLYPNWPVERGGDGTLAVPCEPIMASPGSVIALAFDALAPDGRTRYNAVSWITGAPPIYDEPGQFEVTTLSNLVTLSRLPPTDAGLAKPDLTGSAGDPIPAISVGSLGLVLVLLEARRRRRRCDDRVP